MCSEGLNLIEKSHLSSQSSFMVYRIEKFPSAFSKISSSCATYNCPSDLSTSQTLTSETWDQRERGWMLPRDGLRVRTTSSTQPLKKGIFPTQPNIITSSSSHVLCPILPPPSLWAAQCQLARLEKWTLQSLNSRNLETRGLGDAQEWYMDSGTEWVGWAEARTPLKLPCSADASLMWVVEQFSKTTAFFVLHHEK